MIYRVTQESLSNIVQHARRAQRPTSTCPSPATPSCKVADDGGGFDALAANRNGKLRGRPGGLGLSGMRERALLVGGDLNVFSAPARARPSN